MLQKAEKSVVFSQKVAKCTTTSSWFLVSREIKS